MTHFPSRDEYIKDIDIIRSETTRMRFFQKINNGYS